MTPLLIILTCHTSQTSMTETQGHFSNHQFEQNAATRPRCRVQMTAAAPRKPLQLEPSRSHLPPSCIVRFSPPIAAKRKNKTTAAERPDVEAIAGGTAFIFPASLVLSESCWGPSSLFARAGKGIRKIIISKIGYSITGEKRRQPSDRVWVSVSRRQEAAQGDF